MLCSSQSTLTMDNFTVTLDSQKIDGTAKYEFSLQSAFFGRLSNLHFLSPKRKLVPLMSGYT